MDINSIIADAAATVALGVLSALGTQASLWLRKHRGAKNLALATEVARAGVTAAEQIGAARGWDGQTKLEEAQRRVRGLAAGVGIRMTDEQWRSLIERSVAEMKQLAHDAVQSAPMPDPAAPAP